MQTTLYGLPHWRTGGGGPVVTGRENTHGPAWQEGATAGSREITLTLGYDWRSGFNGDIADVTVNNVSDSAGILTAVEDVAVQQQISFGRPQLPSLRMDVAEGMGTQVPRGVVMLGGQASDRSFDPIITRVITDYTYVETEPDFRFDQWFPTQPVKVNRLGSRFGDGKNAGQLVLYPAQFLASGPGAGTLRAYDQLRVRIYYDDGSAPVDWQAPVLRRVRAIPTPGGVDIRIEATDVGSGIQDIHLLYSLNGIDWDVQTLTVLSSGDIYDGIWSGYVPLNGSTPESLSFIVQAVDQAGNVAYTANKGQSYSGAESVTYLLLVIKND